MAGIRPNPTLSEDLISEILVRVPVKSLLCFQLVCKGWSSLIKHPTFVKSQLLHAITAETDQTLIISPYKRYSEKKFSLLHANSREIVADLKFPYSQGDFNTRIVGSASGIVCFVVALNFPKYKTSTYLWNPAIRQSKLIPSFSNELHCKEVRSDGFGYDPIDHDYKVVRVVSGPSLSSMRHLLSAEVYSANKNVWRKVPDPIDIPWDSDFDVCVNGYLCGIGNYGMMSFDLNKEVFSCTMKLPIMRELVRDEARIIEFNKSIAVVILLIAYNDDKSNGELDNKINMWSLDDDACLRGGGVVPSWTIMFSIDLVTPVELSLGYFCNGDLLLLILDEKYVYKWISCNANKKEAKIFPLSVDMAKHKYCRGVDKYRESLVSLTGFKQVNWNAVEDDN
ncbi:F-box domain-containing protein [Heracleum sosnowskyi]|uniref:F-box domain-containing protein n=1 Tax=Heracleum sosnowskyi TaxID=360622 RepID=A0AAD8GRQ5_9APIA|nr:F-box domain-containing protein [Heracleum sosnowskyi]